jgi:hypothetical protein
MAADSQCWLKGTKLLNAAREATDGGLSKVKIAQATATLNSGDKSDVGMLCDFVSTDTLSLCHEVNELSTDLRRALVEGAPQLKGRPAISIDTPRGLLGLMLNISHNSSIGRKIRSQQSMFE